MHKKFFETKIEDLKAQNIYRSLRISDVLNHTQIRQNDKEFISFCSNDYLGLSQNSEVKKAAISAIEKYGFGAGSSRYISGNNSLYQKLENHLAKIKNCEDAIVFGSGYLSGVSTIAALAHKSDLIIADKLIHSCLIDGAKLSGAKLLRFNHNDIAHAQKILENNRKKYQKCLIITETVFSMDGDLGKLPELLDLALKFGCLIVSDDAHGLGIIKHNFPEKFADLHLQIGTLSKAVGGYGGYVCGSKTTIDYLRNFAKSAIYSTALPPAILAGNLQALEIIENDKKLGAKTLENAQYFCELLNLEKPQSAIVVLIIGDAKKTLEMAQSLEKSGFLISAIRPPTVEKGKSRLRITFNSNHKKSDIEALAKLLKAAK